MLHLVGRTPTQRKPATKRKPHICPWTDQEVWAAVILAFMIGAFIGWCL